jgi:hypothetical protein
MTKQLIGSKKSSRPCPLSPISIRKMKTIATDMVTFLILNATK